MQKALIALALATATACATANDRGEAVRPLAPESAVMAAELPPECLPSDLAPAPDRSLDAWFDSTRATHALSESWPPLLGSVFVSVGPDGASGVGTWGVISDMPNPDAVRDIVETFQASRRDVALPDEELRIFLGDEDGAAPRVIDDFGGCGADLLGSDETETTLLGAVDDLSYLDGVEQVLAVEVDALGRPVRLFYTGEEDVKPVIRNVVATALIASARFRPAHVAGVPVQSRVHLATAEVYADEVRDVNIGGLDRPLREGPDGGLGSLSGSRGGGIQTASRSGGSGGVPCGRGGSQFAATCGYDFSTGRLTSYQVNPQLAALERLERSTERGKISWQIDQRLQRNR